MKPVNHYSQKKRNLAVLAKRLQYLLTYHKDTATNQIEKLILKIKRLVLELAHVVSKPAMVKILGATAFLFGISFANQATAQSFAAPVANPFGIVSVTDWGVLTFADLDGDGDLDLLVGEYYGALKYFQNTGTSANPIFAAPQTNPFGLDSTNVVAFPTFADIDADGDMDLFVGDGYGSLQYFKNTGTASNPQFAAPTTNPFGLTYLNYFALPSFADLDGDGDLDLLVGEYNGIMKYFKNTGTASNPQFAAPQQNPFGLTSTNLIAAPTFADLDKDGDLDLLVGEYYGALKYFKNTGTSTSPQFAAPQTNPFGLDSALAYAFPAFADLDGDGDQDLLVGEYYGNMQYYENLETSPGFANLSQDIAITLYPNPVQDVLKIATKEQIAKIEIINSVGKTITFAHNTNQISLDQLAAGLYTARITFDDGNYTLRKFVKQ